ncbi:uncharacterized protein Ecym_3334 [Eremothecium cymbalariae DBVPG|uniref:TLC domain-containing protein n=1 Tax=Eremothecium cymbalariae (strain CBS 270.75 / DBVPG 7215 / KCTC 17166 / NRRL Y-17582) TaxID=931890 RepID=G8JRQ5_ERECY|nr:Hypothetical protein Ecym_3334 [Eremothecium cymbalariae DBVPG\
MKLSSRLLNYRGFNMSSEVRRRHAEEPIAVSVEHLPRCVAEKSDKTTFKSKGHTLKGPIKATRHVVHSKVDLYTFLVTSFALLFISTGYSYRPDFYRKFLSLQYEHSSNPGHYDIGTDDIYIVFTAVIVLCWIRSFLLEFMLKPFAYYKCNIKSYKSQQRYGEQGWSVIYYSLSWSVGFYLYFTSPYFLDCDYIYLNWPHDQMTGIFKLYYLVQISSWLQQIVVINVEDRRKDHWQMFAHHIITVALTTGSYYYYFTRIGHVILIIMDIVDIFLSTAKILKYCGFSVLCDYVFVVFLILWFVFRHVVYNYIFYHTWAKARDLMGKAGLCGVDLYQKRCWTPFIIDVFLVLLGGLQIITLIWLFLIIKVLIKVIKGTGAQDVRSDEDD